MKRTITRRPALDPTPRFRIRGVLALAAVGLLFTGTAWAGDSRGRSIRERVSEAQSRVRGRETPARDSRSRGTPSRSTGDSRRDDRGVNRDRVPDSGSRWGDRSRYDSHRDGDRGRWDRHDPYDRSDRYDRHDQDRYGHDDHHRYEDHARRYDRNDHHGRSWYGTRYRSPVRHLYLDIPRIFFSRTIHLYDSYHWGRVYWPEHGHYHTVYRFPVWVDYQLAYRPYAYCDGTFFATGYFGSGGPIFDLDIHIDF